MAFDLAGFSAAFVVSDAFWMRTVPVHGASAHVDGAWNQRAAAEYMDRRETWWQEWPKAKRDHGTICISCHTVLPYALARPVLTKDLHEAGIPQPQTVMSENLEKRVNAWSEMVPFYSDEKSGKGKTAESHATEAVLNAVILTAEDTRDGHLRPVTRKALDSAWELQEKTGERAGGWIWQDFHLAPWESSESAYQGAAMLMMAVGAAPDGYAKEAAVKEHVQQLRGFLLRSYATQPVLNQLYVLWASTKMPGVLTKDERKSLLVTLQKQQQEDGGWRLAGLEVRDRADHSAAPTESDGYATAIAVLVMEEAGVKHRDKSLERGVEWLVTHQEKDGRWQTASMNKQRKPDSDAALFMSDAATGYAVLALEKAR